MVFGVEGFRVQGLGFGIWGLGFRVVTRFGGKGNWALALSAYLLVPDIRGKFGKEKKLRDWVEAFAVYHETIESPPPWMDLLYSYICLVADLSGICSDGAYNAQTWRMTAEDLVKWGVQFSEGSQRSGEACFRRGFWSCVSQFTQLAQG